MDVLVIEDDPQIARALRQGLEAEGYTVQHTADGLTGLQYALRHPYQVIVLDVMLPGVHGYRICAELRRAKVLTPILMLTAKNGEHDETEGLDTGADDYLTKPFSYPVLLARLRALIRRGAHARRAGDRLLRTGTLWVDPGSYRCGRGTEEIALTAREFAVLAVLARGHGQVVPKQDILDEAWEGAYDGSTAIVEVYVSALRRKIDAPFQRRSIQTVHGVGYRLVDDAPPAPAGGPGPCRDA
ncbi:response regulator transcription factor [Streptomyces sp. NPDC001941]|uniref:response regulator transcription factor n=1 Tax=Streptomyces sp. NPDC001941 TaxID=3154659 RepID=UPI0033277500